jgi:hypothetical protein
MRLGRRGRRPGYTRAMPAISRRRRRRRRHRARRAARGRFRALAVTRESPLRSRSGRAPAGPAVYGDSEARLGLVPGPGWAQAAGVKSDGRSGSDAPGREREPATAGGERRRPGGTAAAGVSFVLRSAGARAPGPPRCPRALVAGPARAAPNRLRARYRAGPRSSQSTAGPRRPLTARMMCSVAFRRPGFRRRLGS